MVSLGGHFVEALKWTLRRQVRLAISLEADAWYVVKRCAIAQAFSNLQHALFTLPSHNDVDIGCLKCLPRQERRVPSAEDDGKIGVPGFDRLRHFYSFTDHWASDHRDAETQGIFYFFHDALLVVPGDRRVYDTHLVAGVE